MYECKMNDFRLNPDNLVTLKMPSEHP